MGVLAHLILALALVLHPLAGIPAAAAVRTPAGSSWCCGDHCDCGEGCPCEADEPTDPGRAPDRAPGPTPVEVRALIPERAPGMIALPRPEWKGPATAIGRSASAPARAVLCIWTT